MTISNGPASRRTEGGRIDRGRPLSFTFNGRRIAAYAGDTLASALLANGVSLVARSFKYHRPRGVFAHGSEEPNALLTLERGGGRTDPNTRATAVEATAGLAARSQNHWPSLQFDLAAINDRLSPLFAAGFYYKTFKWPRSFWDRVYEPIVRASAGMGRAPSSPDPDHYAHRHAHCDVLVVGAGPAGIAAALAASEAGKRVILADEQAEMGGALLHDVTSSIDGASAWDWLAAALETLRGRPNVTLLPRTTAFGFYNHNHLGLLERVTDHLPSPPQGAPRERLWQVRAREVVLSTGAHERPLVFANNDRPGILLAESLRAYLNRYAVLPGRRIAIVTCGASAYTVAADLIRAGARVTLIDLRPESAEAAPLRALGGEVLSGHTVVGTHGRGRVTGLVVAPVAEAGNVARRRTIACDCAGVSGGWTPAVHLFSQARGKLVFDTARDAFLPGEAMPGVRVAGAVTGTYDLAACLAEGWTAGGGARRAFAASATPTGFAPVRLLPGSPAAHAFVDLQNDVTAQDLGLAVREGFEAVEHVKRYTTTGMATDQGKTSNMNAIGLVADLTQRTLPGVGTTTFRPPYTPVTFGALVGVDRGRLLDPVRLTPTHEWAAGHGAVFEDVGLWKRARYFPRGGEDMHAAVARECRAVRNAAGLLDGSTLGKIEVTGPDAAEFLNRIYTGRFDRLAPGRCRYGLMLREDGYIYDDGVVARLSDDRFHITTTTGGAARVLQHMEDYLQTEWPSLKVHLTSITEQYAVLALQGPKAHAILAPCLEGFSELRHMTVREGRVCGVPCRLFRVSFTGEPGYEINVPADFGQPLWEELMRRGAAAGLTPYGTEAMHVLRAEKGFIIVGQETDGTTTPHDVGMERMVADSKPDFVGKRSLRRPDMLKADRKQLVGLLSADPGLVLDEGAQVVAGPAAPVPVPMLGHVTSSYASATLGHSIALALVAGGRAMTGQRLHVTTPNGFAEADVVAPVFFDLQGKRLDD